jgi:hypothetical protein
MKTLKSLGVALALALSLSIPAYADTVPGDGHGPGRSDPADPGIVSTTKGLAQTDISDPSTVASDLGVQTITDIFWSLASMY